MARTEKSTALYSHPFSKAYWRDAAAELKDIKILVITALMIALRIALKPFAIYIGPQMAIQTATLATALGAMIFGPVMAIPSKSSICSVRVWTMPSRRYCGSVITAPCTVLTHNNYWYYTTILPRVQALPQKLTFFGKLLLSSRKYAIKKSKILRRDRYARESPPLSGSGSAYDRFNHCNSFGCPAVSAFFRCRYPVGQGQYSAVRLFYGHGDAFCWYGFESAHHSTP